MITTWISWIVMAGLIVWLKNVLDERDTMKKEHKALQEQVNRVIQNMNDLELRLAERQLLPLNKLIHRPIEISAEEKVINGETVRVPRMVVPQAIAISEK